MLALNNFTKFKTLVQDQVHIICKFHVFKVFRSGWIIPFFRKCESSYSESLLLHFYPAGDYVDQWHLEILTILTNQSSIRQYRMQSKLPPQIPYKQLPAINQNDFIFISVSEVSIATQRIVAYLLCPFTCPVMTAWYFMWYFYAFTKTATRQTCIPICKYVYVPVQAIDYANCCLHLTFMRNCLELSKRFSIDRQFTYSKWLTHFPAAAIRFDVADARQPLIDSVQVLGRAGKRLMAHN